MFGHQFLVRRCTTGPKVHEDWTKVVDWVKALNEVLTNSMHRSNASLAMIFLNLIGVFSLWNIDVFSKKKNLKNINYPLKTWNQEMLAHLKRSMIFMHTCGILIKTLTIGMVVCFTLWILCKATFNFETWMSLTGCLVTKTFGSLLLCGRAL